MTATRITRLIIMIMLACAIVACGGGGGDDIPCNPEAENCETLVSQYMYRLVPDTAQGDDIFTNNPAPIAGYTLVRN